MSVDDASNAVKSAHKTAIQEVAQRNEAAHRAAKKKREAAYVESERKRRAEQRRG